MRLLTIFICGAALFAQTDQKTNKENMVRDRGQTQVADPTQTLTRGRLGHQDAFPKGQLTITGTLVDGSCEDRSALNLGQWPEVKPAPVPQQAGGGVSAAGVTVDADTLQKERSDIMAHQVPDLRMRQPDATCAITGGTRSFAVLMDNGRLLNLDEGGNTLATQSLLADPEGRALYNGTGPAVKPRVVIQGRIHGDKLIVDQVVRMGGRT